MELLTCVCDAARRFRERSARDEDIAASLAELDAVATITQSLLSAKNCDNAARCAAVDASIAAFRLGNVPADTVRAFARATLDRVLSSSKRPGARVGGQGERRSSSSSSAFPRTRGRTPSTNETISSGCASPCATRGLVDARAFETLAAAVGPGSPIAASPPPRFRTSSISPSSARSTSARPRRRASRRSDASPHSSPEAPPPRAPSTFETTVCIAARHVSSTPFLRYPCSPPPTSARVRARAHEGNRSKRPSRGDASSRRLRGVTRRRPRRRAGVAEAFDFNPNHEADGTMWHGAFGVLRAPSRDDDVVADDAHAAANVASLLGVVTAAGCKTMDAAPPPTRCAGGSTPPPTPARLDVRRRRLARRVDVRRGSGDGAPSQLAR